jgi:hypothetical protein
LASLSAFARRTFNAAFIPGGISNNGVERRRFELGHFHRCDDRRHRRP